MSIFTQAKIDCHLHVVDPARFPFDPSTAYAPAGQELTSFEQLSAVLDSYHVAHAVVVGTNSGYGTDNRCLLDALARGEGRLRGIAVVDNDISTPKLRRLKRSGIVGIAWNPSLLGAAHYLGAADLMARMADLDMILQIQVEHDGLLPLLPLIERSSVRVVFDHCGRPSPALGLDQPGFQALLALGRARRASVKLSGLQKLSCQPYPYQDALPFLHALVDAFTLDSCVWASDWPFLKATSRLDYGPMLALVEGLFPDAQDRKKLLWHTPSRLFGFA